MKSILREDFETVPLLRQVIKNAIVNPLINYLTPKGVLINYLKSSKSPLLQESFKQAGSWRCMKISYENKPPVDFIDQLVLTFGTFPMGLRNRKRLVVRKMVSLIQHYLERGVKDINIVAVGAGTGANTIEALASHAHPKIKAHLFDIADDAFDEGELLKEMHGVQDQVFFIKADMRHIPDYIKTTPHIMELVGILEYFTDDEILKFLREAARYLNSESSVLVNSIEDSQGMRRFLKRTFDFELIYRTPERLMELLSEAGYGDFEIEREPLKVYTIITAHKKP